MAGVNRIDSGRRLAPGLLLAAVLILIYLTLSLTDLWGYLPTVVQASVYLLLSGVIIILLLSSLSGKRIWPLPLGLKALELKALELKALELGARELRTLGLKALGLAAIALAVAAIIAGPDSGRLLEIALKPPALFSYPVPEIIMTVKPPSFSGRRKFTENMSAGDEKTSNPAPMVQGSKITVRVKNIADAPILITGSRKVKFRADKNGGFRAGFTLRNQTMWQVRAGSRSLGQWPILLLEDNPPVIHRVAYHMMKTKEGFFDLSLDISDDFGVRDVVVGIMPIGGKSDSLRDRTNLGIAGLKRFSGNIYVNLAASDFAGRKVDLVVEVTDQAGQTQQKVIRDITIPVRRFSNAFSRQIIKIRRDILTQPGSRKKLARQLMALGLVPDNGQMPGIYYLALRSAYRRLIAATNDQDIASVRNILWALAAGIQDGNRGRFTRNMLTLLTSLKIALYQRQPTIIIKGKLQKIDKTLLLFRQMQRLSPRRTLPVDYNIRALRKLYGKILADSYYRKFTPAINLVSYLEQGFVYNDPLILSGRGFAHFRTAHHARKAVKILEKAQKQIMDFVLKKTIRLEIASAKPLRAVTMSRNRDIRIWIDIQQKLRKKMKDLGRTLQKSGIDAARFTVPAGDLAREVIHSMKDGNMSAAAGYQSQIMTILQNLGNMLDREMHYQPKEL
ncbi:MAG: DUF4175 domain-containing protein [Alphaproteobacteria bacterium]|nr:DUF4175 domain-containing protein [Alphaproteobacteria bacterium]